MEVPAFPAGSGGRGTRPGRWNYRTAFMPGLRRLRAYARDGGLAMSTPDADTARAAAYQLEALGRDLAARGFGTRVMADRHRLNVVNRAVPQIRDDIDAGPADDGAWWFRWSWGDQIAPVTDVATAAFKIAYVLTPTQT